MINLIVHLFIFDIDKNNYSKDKIEEKYSKTFHNIIRSQSFGGFSCISYLSGTESKGLIVCTSTRIKPNNAIYTVHWLEQIWKKWQPPNVFCQSNDISHVSYRSNILIYCFQKLFCEYQLISKKTNRFIQGTSPDKFCPVFIFVPDHQRHRTMHQKCLAFCIVCEWLKYWQRLLRKKVNIEVLNFYRIKNFQRSLCINFDRIWIYISDEAYFGETPWLWPNFIYWLIWEIYVECR